MKISTKLGDNGSTRTHENLSVRKDSNYIEFIGTVDELQSYLGLLEHEDIKQIQFELYEIMGGGDVPIWFDTEIPKQTSFILPSGHWQVARAICRRAERRAVTINHSSIAYLNRLSDYLYKIALQQQ